MFTRHFAMAALLAVVLASDCGSYRFVDPFPAADYNLLAVKNATAEPDLAVVLEKELRKVGGFRISSSNRLSVTVTGFTETVKSIGSSGLPVRQELTMDIAWKVEGVEPSQATFGQESVRRSYPYSSDPPTLDWNRGTAIRLLSERAARKIIESLEGVP